MYKGRLCAYGLQVKETYCNGIAFPYMLSTLALVQYLLYKIFRDNGRKRLLINICQCISIIVMNKKTCFLKENNISKNCEQFFSLCDTKALLADPLGPVCYVI